MDALASAFVDACNRRDEAAFVALTDPQIEFRPTAIVGTLRVYRGHDELRIWVTALRGSKLNHQARIRAVHVVDEQRVLLLTEVLLDGDVISPSAMMATISAEGLIVAAQAYLSDDDMLKQVGVALPANLLAG